MLKAIILEDEVKGLQNLRTQLRQHCKNVEIVAEARSIAECKDLLQDEKLEIDLAFMDIDLPDGLVFSLLEDLPTINFEIIFVTGHNQYALKAFDFASIGYIMKPIDPEKLIQSVSRVMPKQDNQMEKRMEVFKDSFNNPKGLGGKLTISALDGMYFINFSEILRFEAEDNYTHIYKTNGEKITVSKSLKAYEKMLHGLNFYRVHKGHMINMHHIDRFVKGDGGYIVMEDEKKIDVSRRRRGPFMEALKNMHTTI